MHRKLTSIGQALSACTSGSSIALGGATLRRKPMALVRALAAMELEALDLWTWIGSTDVDLLIGAGQVRRVNSAYVGFGAFGLAQTSRRAFVDGTVEFRDWSESSLVASFRAGASGLPVALTRALLGTSLAEGLAEEVRLPFTEERVMVVPAARPDVALIHAQSADEFGNVRRARPNRADDIDHVIAASARHVIVSVEELVESEDVMADRDQTIIPGRYVSAIVLAPGGAHPTGCDGYYDPDLGHVAAYVKASASPEGMELYIEHYVRPASPETYARLVGEAS
jgi:glutaconate CoA-transferase subunit A